MRAGGGVKKINYGGIRMPAPIGLYRRTDPRLSLRIFKVRFNEADDLLEEIWHQGVEIGRMMRPGEWHLDPKYLKRRREVLEFARHEMAALFLGYLHVHPKTKHERVWDAAIKKMARALRDGVL
jgi:hypothetical protein